MSETATSHAATGRASRARSLVAVAGILATALAGSAEAQTSMYAQQPPQVARPTLPLTEQDAAIPEHLRKAIVAYETREAPGTIVIDTGNTYLYYVLGQGRAIRYGVGVGRDGFTWSGVQPVSRKAEWPDWIPPADMIARQPYLPRWVAGGPGNPLGARAIYLGASAYRIHGTNDPTTIGRFVSSGCIRMTNEDVIDLFGRVNVGTRVVVLPKTRNRALDAYAAMPAREISVTMNRRPVARGGATFAVN